MSDDLRYILLDTETTGPTPADRVCEIAWIELDAGMNVLDRVHSLIDPEKKISAGASGVHGLTNEDVADSPTLREFFDIVLPDHMARPQKLDGPTMLIAHNAQFDWRYVQQDMPGCLGQMCTLRLARRAFPEAENHKLPTLMFELGLRRGTSHRADGDVETTLHLLEKIVEATGSTLDDLALESMAPEFVPVMVFGKHKGWDIRTVPTSYFNWLQSDGKTLDMDLTHTIEVVRAERRVSGSKL